MISSVIGGSPNQVDVATQPYRRIIDDQPRSRSLATALWEARSLAASLSSSYTTTRDLTVFAGQSIGIKQVSEEIWLVSFMDYDLGYFDHDACRLEPLENPFGPKLLRPIPRSSAAAPIAKPLASAPQIAP
jgi:hypothetical protein